jgi:polyhydroxyalkanoate synthesis regulator phasin
MSERDPQSEWLESWVSAQRDFWKQFLNAAQETTTGSKAPPPGLEQFATFFGQPLPESSRDLTRRMLDFGQGYLGVAQEFWKLVGAAQAPGGDASRLQGDLSALQSGFAKGFEKLYSGPLGGGEMLSQWQRMVPPANIFGATPGQWPSLPALGLMREQQEAMERFGRSALRYQQALGRFSEMLARVSSDAVERLTKRIVKRSQSGEQIGSFRAVYDLWVDAGEEAYAAAAHGAEFAKAQADLNEALMELKAEQQKQVEAWAKGLDLPTRSEVNSVLKRLDTLRRRVRELEEEFEQLRAAGQR